MNIARGLARLAAETSANLEANFVERCGWGYGFEFHIPRKRWTVEDDGFNAV